MLAEINNKISSSGANLSDRLEDKLTGDVFGALRYLPINIGILPVINQCYSDNKIKILDFLSKSKYAKYLFWPRSHEYGEIDLIIEFYSNKNSSIKGVLGIEVKYHSPISSDQDITTTDNMSEDAKHQLWRYMKLLKEKYPSDPKGLVFLTDNLDLSKHHIEKANILDKKHSDVIGLSISWSKVHRAVYKEKMEKHIFPFDIILSDIEHLLRHKHLDSFIPLILPQYPSIKYKFMIKKVYFYFHKQTAKKIEYYFSQKIDRKSVV